jgi:peptidoglycan/LPS O-acetylase OafA/YrhL
MIRQIPPVVATLIVQAAAIALALGRPSVAQAAVAGVAALLFLLANDARGFSRSRIGILVGSALTTLAALLASLVPGEFGWLGAGVPIAMIALYVLATFSPFSLPRRQNRESAPDPR